MSEPIREQLAKTIWESDDLEPGFSWARQPQEVQRDYYVNADAVLAVFKVEPLSPVGETEAANVRWSAHLKHTPTEHGFGPGGWGYSTGWYEFDTEERAREELRFSGEPGLRKIIRTPDRIEMIEEIHHQDVPQIPWPKAEEAR